MPKAYMDVNELSEYLNVKPSTIYAMVEAHILPHYRFGVGQRLVRFRKEEIDRWTESQRRDVIDCDLKAGQIMNTVEMSDQNINHIIKEVIDEAKGEK